MWKKLTGSRYSKQVLHSFVPWNTNKTNKCPYLFTGHKPPLARIKYIKFPPAFGITIGLRNQISDWEKYSPIQMNLSNTNSCIFFHLRVKIKGKLPTSEWFWVRPQPAPPTVFTLLPHCAHLSLSVVLPTLHLTWPSAPAPSAWAGTCQCDQLQYLSSSIPPLSRFIWSFSWVSLEERSYLVLCH